MAEPVKGRIYETRSTGNSHLLAARRRALFLRLSGFLMKKFFKAGTPIPSPGRSIPSISPGARPPRREPSWAYIRYLERRQRALYRQLVASVTIALMVTLALLAISTISTWPQ